MRTLTVLMLCAGVCLGVFSACSDVNGVGLPPPEDLTGSWAWISSQGGIAGEKRTPGTTGYTMKIVFRPVFRYEEYRNDTLVGATGYVAFRETTATPGTAVTVVRYRDGRPEQTASIAGADTLILADRCMDCYIHVYTRIH